MTKRQRWMLALGLLASCNVLISSAHASEIVNYTYDARGRLVQVIRGGTVNDGQMSDYSYDRADNRARVAAGVAPSIGTLLAGQSVWSSDGRFRLDMQTDGNLVLYGPAGVMWATATNGGSDRRMIMQSDGHLVVYNSADQALWYSGTYGNPGARVWLQNDGNLVIRSSAGLVLWEAGTSY